MRSQLFRTSAIGIGAVSGDFVRLNGIILTFVLLDTLAWPASATTNPTPVVGQALKTGVSPTFKATLTLAHKPPKKFVEIDNRPLKRRKPPAEMTRMAFDAAVQSFTIAAVPTPTQTFEGVSNDDNVNVNAGGVIPPDPNGDVGPAHYVEMVNQLVQVFNKSGTPLTADPVSLSALYT